MAEVDTPIEQAAVASPAAALATTDNKDPSGGKLFIGGISWETTQDGLRYYFEKFGELSDVVLMKDRFTNQPRGFGFVTFADASVVDRVLTETHTLDNKTVEVKKAVPRDRAPPPVSGGGGGGGGGNGRRPAVGPVKKIFVGGLAPSVTEPEFRSYFEKYGKVTDAVVMYDRNTNRSRGFGFITFDEEASVTTTMAETHELDGKRVEVKRAEPREARGPPRGGPMGMGGPRGGRGGYGGDRGGRGFGGPPAQEYGRGGGGGGYGYGGGAPAGYGYGGGAPAGYGYGAAAAYGGQAPAYGGAYAAGAASGGYSYGYAARGGGRPAAGAVAGYGGGYSAAPAAGGQQYSAAGAQGGYEVRGGAQGGASAGGFGPSSYGYAARSARGTDRYRPY